MEVKDTPVTIIVSGRNSATTIRQCLESLAGQDWPIDEILVFDNGSTDGSQDIIRDVARKSSVPVKLVDGGADGFLCTAYNHHTVYRYGGRKKYQKEIIIFHMIGFWKHQSEIAALSGSTASPLMISSLSSVLK